MNTRPERIRLICTTAAVASLAACGGGGGDSTPASAGPAPAAVTTPVSATVIDGAIKNALVCLDKNGNGKCDADETQGKTDATGKVTLDVPNADVGKYPILAVVGTDAVDADNGAVTVAYTMTAPADQVAVVSPLTTLVQQTVTSSGATTAAAASLVQGTTGITTSLFQDFTKTAAPAGTAVDPATVARMLVVTTQRQGAAIASTLGTTAIDGSTITQANLDQAIRTKLLELLPSLVSALSNPAVLAAATPADKQAALLAAATTLVGNEGLTPAAMATVVAINTQNATPTPVVAAAPTAGYNMDTLSYTDASNYVVRTLGASAAQNTPDASNNTKYVERRRRAVGGSVATWGSGGDPWRNADLSWNGSAWASCPINFENTSSVRDASGKSNYTYCGRETGASQRATFDLTGKTLASAYAQIVSAGYTNLYIANAATVLGSATFPTGSALFYQVNTPLTTAISYYPAGANSPAGASNILTQYSAAVAAGGTASAQAAGTACNATETSGSGSNSTTLEAMIATKAGTPCVYGPTSVTYNGSTQTGDAGSGIWWGNSTFSLGTLGSASLTPGANSTGVYTGNTLLRGAFTGTGANAVTYYACQQRFVNGSTRSCTPIGTGSYTISTLGDARALTLNNLPVQTGPLTYNRVFVERGGLIYFGYQSKPTVTNRARLNLVAGNAMLTQLGLSTVDPSTPLALSAASYQGTWDIRDASTAVSPTNGVTLFVNGNGSTSCQYKSNAAGFACTMTVTNPATGAFTYSNVSSGATAAGSFDFMAGTASGSYHDPANMPVDGTLIGGRR